MFPGGHCFQANSGPKAQGAQSQASRAQSSLLYPPSRFCGQIYHGYCNDRRNWCFDYGQPGHMQMNFRATRVATRANKVPIATSLSSAPKGVTSGIGTGWNHFYAFSTNQESESSPGAIIDTLQLLTPKMYCLLNVGSTLSYVTLYVSLHFGFVQNVFLTP